MKVNLGINTCFALKRWPRPADWAAVVRNDLGLDLVELSLDLIEGTETFAGGRDAVERHRAALDAHGLKAHATLPVCRPTRSTSSCTPTRGGVRRRCSGTAPSSISLQRSEPEPPGGTSVP
jgi:hypothetical protein